MRCIANRVGTPDGSPCVCTAACTFVARTTLGSSDSCAAWAADGAAPADKRYTCAVPLEDETASHLESEENEAWRTSAGEWPRNSLNLSDG